MRQAIAPICLLLTYLVLTVPMVIIEAGRPPVSDPSLESVRKQLPSELKDQDDYHLPVIETMIEQWPSPDIVHYESATAPGYHLLMAASSTLTTGTKAPMLLVNWCIGLLLTLTVYALLRRVVPGWVAAALTLPLMLSKYVLGAAIWLTTDNAAMLMVMIVLLLCGLPGSKSGRPAVLMCAGLAAAGAVWTRQIHLWVAAPIGLCGVLASPLHRFVPRTFRVETGKISWVPLIVAIVAAAMPVAVVGALVAIWGGLVPVASEAITKHAGGLNPATPAFALSLCAFFGVFVLGGSVDIVRRVRPGDLTLLIAAAVGLGTALLPATAWLRNVRDYGWLWRPGVQTVPSVADRSLLLAVLAPVGAVMVVVLYRAAAARERGPNAAVLLLTMLGWMLAQSVNAMAWQRYFEPFVLALLLALAALSLDTSDKAACRRLVFGAVALGAGQFALTAWLVYRPFLANVL